MRVYVESVLDCPPEKVWAEVQRSGLLIEVCRPLVKIAPLHGEELPECWEHEGTAHCRSYLFGFIPMGKRTLWFERVNQDTREIQTREHDPLIRRWDHLIRVRPADDGRTLYSDEIEIEAGWRTVFVWLFANWFYRHRQRRWKKIARRLAAGGYSSEIGDP